jgi:hypothetical protein
MGKAAVAMTRMTEWRMERSRTAAATKRRRRRGIYGEGSGAQQQRRQG